MVFWDSVSVNCLLWRPVSIMAIVRVTQMRTLLRDVSINQHMYLSHSTTHNGHNGSPADRV